MKKRLYDGICSSLGSALCVEVPQYVRDVGVYRALLVGLECGGESGLALLAAHQAAAQQVDDHLAAVQRFELPEVGVEGGG